MCFIIILPSSSYPNWFLLFPFLHKILYCLFKSSHTYLYLQSVPSAASVKTLRIAFLDYCSSLLIWSPTLSAWPLINPSFTVLSKWVIWNKNLVMWALSEMFTASLLPTQYSFPLKLFLCIRHSLNILFCIILPASKWGAYYLLLSPFFKWGNSHREIKCLAQAHSSW